MTNELEKQFFDTFEIKPNNMCKYAKYGYDGTEGIWYLCNKTQEECWTYPSDTTCKDKMTSYPEITDRILLELICILGNTSYFLITGDGLPIDVDVLKKSVLHSLTLQAKVDKNKVLKYQVRTLFEEG